MLDTLANLTDTRDRAYRAKRATPEIIATRDATLA
jgi:hypothetical protein